MRPQYLLSLQKLERKHKWSVPQFDTSFTKKTPIVRKAKQSLEKEDDCWLQVSGPTSPGMQIAPTEAKHNKNAPHA